MPTAKSIQIVLFRNDDTGAVRCVALQDCNLVIAGPVLLEKEEAILRESDRLEKCLTDNAQRPTPRAMSEFGRDLAATLFLGRIRELVSVNADDRLQIGLCCTDPKLNRIPWEFLVWPTGGRPPNPIRTIARVVPVADGTASTPVDIARRALQVCLLVADPTDMDRVPWDELRESLNTTFAQYLDQKDLLSTVELDIVEGATLTSARIAIERKPYDVIHFLGHGDPEGLYFVDRKSKKSVQVSTDTILTLFCRPSVQLVILSACRTATQEAKAGFQPLAEALVENQVPAVIGSQMPIAGAAIACFCTSIYQTLITGGDIDTAVAAGRVAVKIELGGISLGQEAPIEWGIPVLYRRPGRAQLFSRS